MWNDKTSSKSEGIFMFDFSSMKTRLVMAISGVSLASTILIGGFFLCLLDRHLARLRPLVVFIENADSHLRLFLELRFDIRFEILTVARNVRFIVPDILKDEEAADQDGRGQRNAADRHDQPCFHG